MKKSLIVLVSLAVIGVLGYAIVMYSPLTSLFNSQSNDSQNTTSLSVETKNIQDETDTYKIDVQYPQFGISSVDARIQSAVQNVADGFKGYSPIPADSAAGKNQLTGIFDHVYIGDDYISFAQQFYEYTGGAHGNPSVGTLTFERTTNRELDITDLLDLTGLSLDQIATQASTTLAIKYGDAFWSDGTNPNAENYANFVVSTSTVTVIFNPYQVAPYAAGMPEVTFPRVK